MNEYKPVHPFWRALAGAGMGLAVGVIGLKFGFWAALLVLLLIIVGAVVGVLGISGD